MNTNTNFSTSHLIDRPQMMLDEALYMAAYMKKPIFPVSSQPGSKKPLVAGGFKAATTDPEIIQQWFGQTYRGAMIGLPTGQITGLLAIDVDMKNGKDGLQSLRIWEDENGVLPDTLTVKTPTGGYHLIYELPEGVHIPCGVSVLGEGIDIRADGGYVVALGSINEAWESYSFDSEEYVPVSQAPQFLLNFLVSKKFKKEPIVIDGVIPEGRRNSSLFRFLSSCYGLGMTSRDLLERIAQTINPILCKPPMSEEEVSRIVESVFRYEPSYSFDAMGNADRFADRYCDFVKCINGKDWFVYDSGIYVPDVTKQTNEMAKVIARDIEAEAKHAMAAPDNCLDDDIKKALNKLAKTTKNSPLTMLPLAASDPRISIDPKLYDQEPHFLNCKNCIVDLNTGERLDHDPKFLMTRQCNANFDTNAKTERWNAFLSYAMEEDQEMVNFLARLYGGVGLYGGNPDHVMAIIFGHGRNGKSIFIEALRYVMGSYSDVIRQEVLMARTTQNIGHDIADLKGARFLSASETPPGARLNGSVIKHLTGGDMMKGRHIYQNSVTFPCEGLISLVTNWEPEIEAGDAALKARLLFIKFGRVVPKEKQNVRLADELKQEADGILAWLVRGRLDYLKQGLNVPQRVWDETRQYNTDMDSFENFITSECILDPLVKEQAKDIYNRYRNCLVTQWEGKNMLTEVKFYKLLERSFPKKKVNGKSYYHGIKLIPTN